VLLFQHLFLNAASSPSHCGSLLLGVQILSDSQFDFLRTGLFCHQDDTKTIEPGNEFQKKIGNKTDEFIVMPYSNNFERMLKLDLTWELMELESPIRDSSFL